MIGKTLDLYIQLAEKGLFQKMNGKILAHFLKQYKEARECSDIVKNCLEILDEV